MTEWQLAEELGEKPAPFPLRPSKILPLDTRDLARVSTLRKQCLATWAMARPYERAENTTFA